MPYGSGVRAAVGYPHLTLATDALDAKGRGVARNPEGKVAFVEGALPGEQVEAALVRRRPAFDLMRTVALLRESCGRRVPKCVHFGICGGCATQHADMRSQMAVKQRWLEDCLQRIGKLRPETLMPIVYGAEWGYRHRARFTVRRVAKKGGVLVGFHERHSSFVAEMTRCEVLPESIGGQIPALRELVESLSVRERVPQIEVAVGASETALVFRHLEPLSAEDEVRLRAFAKRAGVWVWLQPGGPATAHPFYPSEGLVLDYQLPEFDLHIAFGPTDFTQVNHAVNRVLVSRAVRLLDPRPGERIADLFCGVGNFSLPLARCGATVVGLEGSPELIARANQNAVANGLVQRAEFATTDLSSANHNAMTSMGPFDKVLLDPPREGAVAVLKALPEDWPRRVVYVSCDPATLARDAAILVHGQGFRLAEAGVVNMFPHTAHVESIALFERP